MAQDDFNKILSPAPDPISPNGGLLVAAGDARGQAAQAKASGNAFASQTEMDLLAKGVGVGMDAYKGKLSSDMEKGIRQTIDTYENTIKLDNAVSSYDILTSDRETSSSNPQAVQAAISDINKYGAAVAQGTMSREQALLTIDSLVKDYSNRMPGWASDFRKEAAQITGVEHMGAYREHMLLATASSMEKRAAQQADYEKKAIGLYIDTYGRLPRGGINGSDMKVFAGFMQLKASAEESKKKLELEDTTIAMGEKAVENIVNVRLAGTGLLLNDMVQGVTGVGPDGKPIQAPDRVKLREDVLSKINGTSMAIAAEIQNVPSDKLSRATRESLLNRVEATRKTYVEALQNQDNFDSFKKLMEFNASSAQDVLNRHAVANPFMHIMQRYIGAVPPDILKMYLDTKGTPGEKRFNEIYGGFSRYMRGVGLMDPESSAEAGKVIGNALTDPKILESLKAVNPGQAQVVMHTISSNIQEIVRNGWGTTPEAQASRKENFGKYIATMSSQVDFTDKSVIKQWQTLLSDPAVVQRLKELSPEQRNLAVDAIATKTSNVLQDPTMGDLARLGKIIREQANNPFNPDKNIVVTYNATTKQFEASVGTAGKLSRKFTELPGGAAGIAITPSRQELPIGGDFKAILDSVNRNLGILGGIQELTDEPNKNIARDYFNKFSAGYFDLSPEQRDAALGISRLEGGKGPNLDTKKGQKQAREMYSQEDPYGNLAAIEAATAGKATPQGIRLQLLEIQDELKKTTNPTAIRILREEMLRLEDALKGAKE